MPDEPNYENLTDINSSNFATGPYNIDNNFANEWVNNLDQVKGSDLGYLTLMKTFGSEEIVQEISNNSEFVEIDGKKFQIFKVDGVEYELEFSDDSGDGQSSATLSSSASDYEFTMHHNANYENGVSFGENFTDEFGDIRRTWENAGGLISQKQDDSGEWVDSAIPITRSLKEAFGKGENIKSIDFEKNGYEIDNGFANQWVNDLGREAEGADLAHLTLMKTFDSEEMVAQINQQATYEYEDGKTIMKFKVDGVEFELVISDDNDKGVSQATLANSENDYEFTMHNDSNLENGLSFGESFTDEFGDVRRTWRNEGGFISQKQNENSEWVDSAIPITKSLRDSMGV